MFVIRAFFKIPVILVVSGIATVVTRSSSQNGSTRHCTRLAPIVMLAAQALSEIIHREKRS